MQVKRGRRHSSYSFLTSAQVGGEWSASLPGRALPPVKDPLYPVELESGWAPESFWTQMLEEKYIPLLELEHRSASL
jgi:hypothetical protein